MLQHPGLKNSKHRFQEALINILTCMSDCRRGFGLKVGFADYLQVVTTNNYNTIANFHTLQITR
jgi:hypothetical protein